MNQLPNQESGALADIFNYKVELARACIDYDILKDLMMGLMKAY